MCHPYQEQLIANLGPVQRVLNARVRRPPLEHPFLVAVPEDVEVRESVLGVPARAVVRGCVYWEWAGCVAIRIGEEVHEGGELRLRRRVKRLWSIYEGSFEPYRVALYKSVRERGMFSPLCPAHLVIGLPPIE